MRNLEHFELVWLEGSDCDGCTISAPGDTSVDGELDPYGLVAEASIADERAANPGSFSSMGEEEGRLITHAEWLERLAPQAQSVLTWGDCAVWGGPRPTRWSRTRRVRPARRCAWVSTIGRCAFTSCRSSSTKPDGPRGAGSTFSLWLPLDQDVASTQEEA